MSTTIKAQVLSKAIELWADPKRRLKCNWGDEARGYCAAGVLDQAHWEITGFNPDVDQDNAYAKALGYRDMSNMIVDNDFGQGPSHIYARMQAALAKELG